MRRWKIGHHTFHVLLAAMNTRLDQAVRHLEAGEWQPAATAIDDLVRLYDAATSAMRFTGDFARREYETLIRPSMMPPFASPGFSGTANPEHGRMLEGVHHIRLVVRSLGDDVPPEVAAAWDRLRDSQRTNRQSHMFVCRKFVEDQVSLLREHLMRQEANER